MRIGPNSLGSPQTSAVARDDPASTASGSAAPPPLSVLPRPPRASASEASSSRPRVAIDGVSPKMEMEALEAIGKNRPGDLHKLIQLQPALLTSRLKTGQTLLTHAIEEGSMDSVRVIIEMARLKEAEEPHKTSLKSVVDMPDTKGRTPLICAARLGKPHIADMLLYADHEKSVPLADVNFIDHSGFTALNHAIRGRYGDTPGAGRALTSAILRRPDVIPDLAGNAAARPVEAAIELGLPEAVHAIINHPNTDPNAPNAHGQPPLWQAISQWESNLNLFGNAPQWEKILCSMMSNPRVVHTANGEGEPPLTQLCHCPYPALLHKTLRAVLIAARSNPNLDINAADGSRRTALQVLQEQTEHSQEYAPIATMLGKEAYPRELEQMRNRLGTQATPEMGHRARSFIPKLKQAEQAAAAGRVGDFNRLAGEIMDELDEFNEEGEIQEGDYISIMDQLGKTHGFAGAQSDQESPTSAARPARSLLESMIASQTPFM